MAEMTIDQIMFDLEEPQRTHAIKAFLDPVNDTPVKLKPFKKGTIKVRFRGEVITVPPAGRMFGRRSAVEFLFAFGKGGQYIGKDMATGLTQTMLDVMDSEEREHWMSKGVKILDNWVYAEPIKEDDELQEDVPETEE